MNATEEYVITNRARYNVATAKKWFAMQNKIQNVLYNATNVWKMYVQVVGLSKNRMFTALNASE
jgi:hypothetical protein